MIRWVFAVLIFVHGLIHLMGFAKAFGLVELPQLTRPVSPGLGLTWLFAAVALVVTSITIAAAARSWWVIGFTALLLSQLVIGTSWSDAKFGTVLNVVLLIAVLFGFFSNGPWSFRAAYRREVDLRLDQPHSATPVTEAQLTTLPEPVQRYLRLSGAVGHPRVHHFKAIWRGRIRANAEDKWMSFTAEQYNFVDEPSRFFLMDARRTGLPVDVFHIFEKGRATMRVRLLSAVPLVDASGAQLTRAETVTLFNDLCVLAPSELVDGAIRWEAIDNRSAMGFYTVGSNTVSARLVFNDDGELVDFVSDDRLAASADGQEFVRQQWSTPLAEYTNFGNRRVASRGRGRWHPPEGVFTYIELELIDLQINPPNG